MRWTAPLLCLLALALSPLSSAAQSGGRIAWTVTESGGGRPLPNVTVTVTGTQARGVTGADGRYTIAGVPAGSHTVSVTGMGYGTVTRTVTVTAGATSTVDVQLAQQAILLDEVVAVGYGTQRRSDLTGSVASVDMEAVERMPVTSIDQMLQGTVPGVEVQTASSAPGGGISIRVRGGTSVSAGVSSEPLYVIDGFPVEVDYAAESPGAGGRSAAITVAPNPLTALNPRDIESIEILKDASALAIYGARAANGVVLITTKQGQAGAPRVSVEMFTGTQSVARRYDLLTGPEYAQFVNEWAASQDMEPIYANPPSVPSTDWQDLIFRDAPLQSYQASVTGGTSGASATRYAVSAGHYDQDGVVLGSAFERTSLRLNLNQEIGPRLRLGTNLTGSRVRTSFAPTDGAVGGSDASAVAAALQYLPTLPVYREDGTFTEMIADAPPELTGALTLQDIQNPVAVLTSMKDVLGDNRVLGNLFGEYDLAHGLTFRSSLGANVATRTRDTYWPRVTLRGEQTNGQAIRGRTESSSWLNENTLSLNRTFGEAHLVNAVVGYTRQISETTRTSMTNENFLSDDLGYHDIGAGNREGGPLVTSGQTRATLASYLGRVNYNLLGRYLFTLTGRYDGSSRFGPDRKWGFFPSAAFAWRLSQEPFMRDVEALDELKLRVAYGATGNAAVQPYQSLAVLDPRNTSFGGTTVTGYRQTALANRELGWETTYQFDAGVDVGLWGWATLTADYYNRRTEDLLFPVQLPLETGFREVWQNAGTVRNRGVELAVGVQPLRGDGVRTARWSNSFNFARNRNEVLDLGGLEVLRVRGISANFNFPGTDIRVGHPIGVFYGYRTDGMFRDSAEAANYPAELADRKFFAGDARVLDLNGDSLINELDRTVIGDPNPDYTLGWNSTVGWRGLELSTFLHGSFGSDVLNLNLIRVEGGSPTTNVTRERFLNRWTPENPGAEYPRIGANSASIGSNYVDTMLEDGSYLRLANVTLTYNLPGRWVSPRGLREARVYVTGSNLHTWTRYSGYNPDVSSMGVGNVNRGVDVGAYPLARTLTIGVNVGY
ncbi:MAG TPA: TonB-dependent receptor [Longimicrobium sp.]|nr:TonB-dependent receptor [Longimicrobium sp.]